jgi:hypothetical protein
MALSSTSFPTSSTFEHGRFRARPGIGSRPVRSGGMPRPVRAMRNGAGGGNRTRISCLEGKGLTITQRPLDGSQSNSWVVRGQGWVRFGGGENVHQTTCRDLWSRGRHVCGAGSGVQAAAAWGQWPATGFFLHRRLESGQHQTGSGRGWMKTQWQVTSGRLQIPAESPSIRSLGAEFGG